MRSPRPTALALAISALCAGHAHADGAAAEAAAEPSADATQQLGRVEVVGSRIKRVDIETSQPVLVLERADIERTGLISVGDILQQIVVHGSDLNTKINNGGDGEQRVNLRNLGSNRTLVLVNGRRWVSQLDGAVDLTTIPLAIVERIEVLKDGASAIYGSDAIAGVVNLTTRKHYDGAEAHGYFGEFEQGDGRTESYDVTIGADRDKANVVLNAAYQKQEPVWAGDRGISAIPAYGRPANDACAGASLASANGRFIVPGLNNGPGEPCASAPASGYTLIEGRPGTSPGDFRFFDFANDGFNYAPANYLLTPQERTSLYLQGRYELGANTAFNTEILYNERRSAQLLAPGPFFIDPAQAGATGNVGISATNLYNPFGRTINRFARRFVESGGREFDQDIDTWRFAAGFDGAFDLFDRSFTWDAHALYSKNEKNETDKGLTDVRRVANALGPSFLDESGTPRCGTPDDPIDGCVPLNLFGGAGSITPEMIDYVGIVAHQYEELELTSYAANVTGDLFQLPSGPLGMAAGYEYRRERGLFEPDSVFQSGQAGGGVNNFEATQGAYSVDEAYLELNVPLLSDKPFAEVLELNVAARYSNYSNFGATVNSKAGFRWKPHADLLVRGNWSQGFRAPSVLELFEGRIDAGGDPLDDPCHPGSQPTAAVRARCTALGVPQEYELPEFTNFNFGGNPDLQPETAVARTLGLVYSPSWLPGFDLYLDWYSVVIDQPIGALDPQIVVNRCYELGDPLACARITRNEAGQIFIVDGTNQNVATGFETEGYDLTLSYRFDTPYGRFQIRSDSAYVDYYGDRGRPARLTTLEDGTVLQGNLVATRQPFSLFGEEWRIKSNLVLSWTRGDWSASVTGRYFSPLEEDCRNIIGYASFRGAQYRDLCDDPDRVVDLDGDGIGDAAATNELDETWYFDAQAGWDTPWKAHVAVGINNVFDQGPPVSRSTPNSFLPSYDIPGRFWYVEYTQKF